MLKTWFKSRAGRRPAILLSIAAVAAVLFLPTTSSASPSCSGTAQLRAALVVDTGSGVSTYCVSLDAQSVTGIHLIQLAGQQYGLNYILGFAGAAVCSLAGVGDSEANCFDSFPLWWGYFHGSCSSGWSLAPTGADSYIVHAGDIEGWVWAVDDANGNHPSPSASLIGHALHAASIHIHPNSHAHTDAHTDDARVDQQDQVRPARRPARKGVLVDQELRNIISRLDGLGPA